MDDSTLQQTDYSLAREASLARPTPPSLPGYRAERRLGAGSFGEVWAGVQASTGQEVAIKVLHMAGRELEREVERLRQVSEHPYVVSLLDANLRNDPAFLVMPLLARSLSSVVGYVQDHPALPLDQIVTWLEQAATALQYVHGRGLLHCDLKPANLLLDSNQTVRVADFGQALLQSDQELRLGTLFFMPSEQADLERAAVPAVSWDVYALGASFYQLLTGRLPRSTPSLQEELSSLASSREVLARYSSGLREAALVPIRRLDPSVDRELACIVEHCLESQAERRYQDMGSLLADLQRRRKLQPLACKRATPGYLLERFLRRHRVPVLVAVLATVTLLVGATASYLEIRQQRNLAQEQAQQARQQAALAREHLAQFHFQIGSALEGTEALLQIARAVEESNPTEMASRARRLALQLHRQCHPRLLSKLRLLPGQSEETELGTDPGLGILDQKEKRLLVYDGGRQRQGWVRLEDGARTWFRKGRSHRSSQVSRDGRGIAFHEEDEVCLWRDGREVARLPAAETIWVRLDPAGKTLVLSDAEDEDSPSQTLRFYDASTGVLRGRPLPVPSLSVHQTAFSPDGSLLAHVGKANDIHVLQVNPPRSLWSRDQLADVEEVSFSPDSGSLLLRHRFAVESVVSRTGRTVRRVPSTELTAAAFLGKRAFLSLALGRGGSIWQYLPGQEPEVHPLPAVAQTVAWQAERDLVALGCADGKVRLFRSSLSQPEAVMQCDEPVHWVDFCGSELLAFSGPRDRPRQGTLWRWQLPPDGRRLPLAPPCQVSLGQEAVVVWSPSRAQAVVTTPEARGQTLPLGSWPNRECLRVLPVGSELVAVFDDHLVQRYRRSDGSLLGEVRLDSAPQAIRPDGRAALLSKDGRRWREVSLTDGSELRTDLRVHETVELPVYSANGQVVLARCPERNSVIRLFFPRPTEFRLPDPIRQVTLAPDGQVAWVAVGGEPGQPGAAFGIDVEKGGEAEELGPRLPHADMVSAVVLSPDGKLVLTVSCDRSAVLWDIQSRRPLRVLRHDTPLQNARFSPDGLWLVTVGLGGQARVWDVRSGLALSPPLPNDPDIVPVFNSQQELVTLVEGRLRFWPLTDASSPDPYASACQHTGVKLEGDSLPFGMPQAGSTAP